MAKRNKQKRQQEEPRELTRKEVRVRARDAERNQKLYMWAGGAIGLVLLLLIIGAIIEFLVRPNSAVATVGDDAIVTREYRKRVLLEQSQLIGRLGQLQQFEQQFGGQGFFAQQIQQLQSTLSSPTTLGIQVLNQLIDEKIVEQEAEVRGIVINDEEIDEALREEVAAGQGAVTEGQATSTAEAAIELTATAELFTPTPSPTIDISATITATAVVTATATEIPTPTPRPILTDGDYEEGLNTLEDNLDQIANLSLDEYREVIRARLVSDKLREELGEEVPETELQVNARHILLSIREPTPTPTPIPEGEDAPEPTPTPTELPEGADTPTPTPGPRDDAATLAEIETLRKRIVEDGEDFAEIAQEYSEDRSNAPSGGDLGWFGSGRMVAPFEEKAFTLEVDEVSEPVKTQFGYHLIQVLERDEERPKDEAQIEQERREAYDTWLNERVDSIEIDRPNDIESLLPPSVRNVSAQPRAPLPVQNQQ